LDIDTYIDSLSSDPYASYVFHLFRLPAMHRMRWAKWIDALKLFCNYEGKRYRVTGASRFGDVWLTSDFAKNTGYEHRVDVEQCSNWGPTP
jgi:hypothetical protein